MSHNNQDKIPAAIMEPFLHNKLEWGNIHQIDAIRRYNEFCRMKDLLRELDLLPIFEYDNICPVCAVEQ